MPDGMKCDERGNVWVTAPGGVWVYAPTGELLGKVRVPELVANLPWGGPDFRTLFMTATHSVYAVRPRSARASSPTCAPAGRAGRSPAGARCGGAASAAAPPSRATRSIRAAARSSFRTCRTM